MWAASSPARCCSLSGLRRRREPSAAKRCSTSPRAAICVEAAANLFSHLRALDAAGGTAIAVMPIPSDGLGEAINDRLARAAAGR